VSFKSIKRDRADILWSEYLREKVGHCEICYKTEGLELSHFFGRRNESTRFDPENCDILCNYHHRNFHENPGDYKDWKLKKMGQKRYDALVIRAKAVYHKKDRNMEVIKIKALMKSQKETPHDRP
jgi:hypothetical protein